MTSDENVLQIVSAAAVQAILLVLLVPNYAASGAAGLYNIHVRDVPGIHADGPPRACHAEIQRRRIMLLII